MGTYKLNYPIEYEGKEIAEVPLNRLKVKDVREQDKEIRIFRESRGMGITEDNPVTDYDLAVFNISKITGLRVEAVEEMDLSDFSELSSRTSGFFGSKTKTAGES